jgi:hypothetical protein
MDYSTTNNHNFYIKKNSTLPKIKYALTDHIMQKYDLTEDKLKNVAVTFSMINAETGRYKIANAPARLAIVEDISGSPDETKYTLTYKFSEHQTGASGRYWGEFVVDLIGDYCGKIKFPQNDFIQIFIDDSITKTTII